MGNTLPDSLFRFFASLRLTVVLLALAILVVFFGTLDQVKWGVRHAQDIYFESFVAWTPIFALIKMMFTQVYDVELARAKIPLPGGSLLGLLLIINLVCAHFRHFKPRWKHLGISVLHGGLVLLLFSGFLVGFMQEESQMWIDEGARSNYSQSIYDNELVLIDTSGPDTDRVTAVPQSLLKDGAEIPLANLGVRLRILDFMPNSGLLRLAENPGFPATAADSGVAVHMGLTAMEKPRTFTEREVNTATAIVEVWQGDQRLGCWLVSNVLDDERFPPQRIEINGQSYIIALRFERTYYPFWLELENFTHEKYPGTDIPKHFASDVRLVDPERGENRPVKIYMNHPLRYRGLTFYQASFGPQEESTMLQVVANPAYLLPYLAVALVGLGMTIHFIQRLVNFASKGEREKAA